MGEPQNHCAGRKKPDTKKHILYGFIEILGEKNLIYNNRRQIRGCLGPGVAVGLTG